MVVGDQEPVGHGLEDIDLMANVLDVRATRWFDLAQDAERTVL
jgi:hypothetical protein